VGITIARAGGFPARVPAAPSNPRKSFMSEYCHPAWSELPRNAKALAKEVELKWAKPEADAPLWLRESFCTRRPKGSHLWAYTTDSRGRIVRAFTAKPECISAYADLQRQKKGTCPGEGVWPPSIIPGQPAEPAHPYLLQRQGS